MKKPLSILAVGAHPDDIAAGIGAVLSLYRELNANIHEVYLTAGDAGGSPKIRKQEAQKEAKILGASLEFLQGNDCDIDYNTQKAHELAKIIRQHQPDVVFAPVKINQDRYDHHDHFYTSAITLRAVEFASYENLNKLQEPHWSTPNLLYYSMLEEPPQQPNILIPIDESKHIKKWKESMLVHQSQLKQNGPNFTDIVLTRAQLYGYKTNTAYAIALWSNTPLIITKQLLPQLESSRNF